MTSREITGNYTYEYSNDAIWESKQLQDTHRVKDYSIGYATSPPLPLPFIPTNPQLTLPTTSILASSFSNSSLEPKSDFIPTPSIAQANAELILFFLSANSIIFAENTTDEWYRATHVAGRKYLNANPNATVPVYAQDEPASPLACVQQEQLCFPSLPADQRCTPLAARNAVYESAGALLLGDGSSSTSAAKAEAADRLQWVIATAFTALQLESIVHTLGTRSLLSRFSLYSNVQAPLPDDQWQREVELWHDTVLAFMQESFVAAARGQSDDPRMDKLFMEPDSAEAKSICRNQKIRSTAYVSFSLLGLALILALGALIIVVAATLEPLVGCVQRRWGKARGQYARLEWTATETLQLQRLAHEELGFGGAWTGAAETVPVTAPGELLAMLDVRDLEHPRLLGKEGAGLCEESEKVGDQQGGGEVVSGAKQGVDGEAELRVTVQHTQGSSFSGGSEETLGRDESVSPTEVVTREA
ncbi:uncharacterized protein LTHEOB_10436 [Lasiodiplodia theobromae]|uniref:uncharacterized protein n=1 Tax=Lasiodiplodia theobromae TaxID=45133 RepID=UPI0015C2DE6B|nr:uncharacterized protein LTHEOB_10436 [Lasiodiplodia theobromae]KAF4539272.1 hypothetical protein LTHEOB_10436 [Lasiodiplodia theobromae]